MEQELRECAFCKEERPEDGGSTYGLSLGRTRVWWVSCLSCGAEGPHAKTRKAAIAAWNTRPGEKALAEALEFYVQTEDALDATDSYETGAAYSEAMTKFEGMARAALAARRG